LCIRQPLDKLPRDSQSGVEVSGSDPAGEEDVW
jgi:hypothetical protein